MRKQRGFTLIELLIVVAIIGIIAAIAIPNLLDAIERSRQKRSTAEVKTVANAIQAFSTDYGGYPSTAHNGSISPGSGLANAWNDAAGSPVFVPDYIQALPPADGWGVPYTCNFGPDGVTVNTRLGQVTALHFTLGCLGNDRIPSAGNVTDPGAAPYTGIEAAFNLDPQVPPLPGTLQTHCYMTDIVWGDSSFLQAPDGKQKNCA